VRCRLREGQFRGQKSGGTYLGLLVLIDFTISRNKQAVLRSIFSSSVRFGCFRLCLLTLIICLTLDISNYLLQVSTAKKIVTLAFLTEELWIKSIVTKELSNIQIYPLSKELTRGAPELVQHFRL